MNKVSEMRSLQKLESGWFVQSSAKIPVSGETISTAEYQPQGWYPVSVPCTTLDAMARNGACPDPYVGLNLKKIPGWAQFPDREGIKKFENFNPMTSDSPFRPSWWFQTTFTIDPKAIGKTFWLRFDGISYAAHVWMNGERVGHAGHMRGTYRRFEIDVTRVAKPGPNVVALEIFAPLLDDLANTFVDWNPHPQDKSMGIWQPVWLVTSGNVTIRNTYVQTKLDIATLKKADLTVVTELCNRTENPVKGTVKIRIGQISIAKKIELEAYETRPLTLGPKEFPKLRLKNPRVWWPYQWGKPELYDLDISFETAGVISDREQIRFGIRDVKSKVNKYGSREFSVNGRPILIRGAAWSPDLLMRQSPERDEADIAYLKNMNLNTIRFEGKFGTDYFWDLCDREGILVMAGWCCACHWEEWAMWKPGDLDVALASATSQLTRLRTHPSLFVWFYGSDRHPPKLVEEAYLRNLKELVPGLPHVAAATKVPSKVTGPTGVKMSGPYSYVAPSYWYRNDVPGVAKSYNTETGPNVCIPSLETLKRMFPDDQRFSGSEAWNLHTGNTFWVGTGLVDAAMDARYGHPKDLPDYVKTAQVLGYECWRAMFEAYGRNFPEGTGVIAWMLNNAWPSLIWHLYDYYLYPSGGLYGSQKACEPLHIQYSYDDHSVVAVNRSLKDAKKLHIKAKLFDVNLNEIWSGAKELALSANKAQKALSIPTDLKLPVTYLLHLQMEQNGACVSRNFYWLSTKADQWTDKYNWWGVSDITSHADTAALRNIPKAEVKTSHRVKEVGEELEAEVTIENSSPHLAFFLEAKVINQKNGEWVVPVMWDSNCESLLPGETITLRGTFKKNLLAGAQPGIRVEGWNL